MKKIVKYLTIALAFGFVAQTAQAVTLSYTEGKRAQVAGTTVISPTDATNTPPGFDLGSIGAGDNIDVFGRIVGAKDVFEFTSSSAFRVDLIFGGFDLEAGGSVSDSGFIIENSGSNNSTLTLDILAPVVGSIASIDISTDITSGLSFLFGGDAGTYQFAINGNGGAALYDIRISAVPLPAALPLMGAGMALMGFVGWRKKRKAAV